MSSNSNSNSNGSRDPKCGVSRRRFCAQMGTGIGLLFLGACEGPPRLSTGLIDDGDPGNGNENGADFAGSNVDMAHAGGSHPDMTTTSGGGGGGSCATGSNVINTGAASAIPSGTYKLVTGSGYAIFVCHDGGGLFAMNAACPHEGVTLTKRSGDIYCRRHGATFDLNGEHPTRPATRGLSHYSVCLDGSGNLLVDLSRTVATSTRA